MYTYKYSYLSPKLVVRERADHAGPGLVCVEPVAKDEVLVVWSGMIVTLEALQQMEPEIQRHSVQVEDNMFLASWTPDEAADYVNHCCDPNAGLRGQLVLVAMRDIVPGEEVCFDYAMSDSAPYDEFECACGAENCRGRVTGNDWKDPVLWDKYDGYFSAYLQHRINQYRKEMLPAD